MRAQLLAARRAIDPASRQAWDARIGAHVLAWCARHAVRALAVYWPLRGEPDLRPAYAALAADGVRLALPVVIERDAALGFAAWLPGEAMRQDGMGVAVPADMRPLPRPPALLVPCLGFNGARLRLGYGGGYYDRTLAAAPRPLTAGIAYACLAAVFDGEAHDIALDAIVTQDGQV
ncbi:MAG: 5-formyltetrahydrofolate cyclo-ligase [Pseudomonadota bacterium]